MIRTLRITEQTVTVNNMLVQEVDLKATVQFTGPKGGSPNGGLVTFYRGSAGGRVVGTAALINGVATLPTTSLPAGQGTAPALCAIQG